MKTFQPRSLSFLFMLALSVVMPGGCILGGGSDHPNEIIGSVVMPDGKPAAAARISLYTGSLTSGIDGTIEPAQVSQVHKTRADKQGRFKIPADAGSVYFIEALSNDSSGIVVLQGLEVEHGRNLNSGTLRLENAASIEGQVVSSVFIETLYIAGTQYRALPDSAGGFAFPVLPPGPARIFARVRDFLGAVPAPVPLFNLAAGDRRNVESITLEPKQVPLFNFDSEEEDRYNLMRGILFPQVQPDNSNTGKWVTALPWDLREAGAYRGKSLYLGMDAGEKSYVWLGNGNYDLSAMDAIVFMAKGSGRITIEISTGLVEDGEGPLFHTITLTPEWSEFRIRAQDIVAPPGSVSGQKGYTWEQAKDRVSRLRIIPTDGSAQLWIDEFRLEGLSHDQMR